MNEILNCFNLPENALMKNRIPIKTIVEQLDVPKSDENLLRSQISAMYLIGILDTETTLLKSVNKNDFVYEEIQVFFIDLKTMIKNIALHNKLQALFPNPTIIITKYQNIYTISTAEKRMNQLNSSLAVVEQVYLTNSFKNDKKSKTFLKTLNYHKYQFSNLYDVYETYQNIIYSERLIELTGIYPEKLLDARFIKDILVKISSIEIEINRLNESNKEATSMNEKMTIHQEMKRQENNKNTLIERIKEEINNG
jgi:hypothetical protein